MLLGAAAELLTAGERAGETDTENADQHHATRGIVGGRESGAGLDTERPTLLLGIGTGGVDDFYDAAQNEESMGVVSESPTAAEFDVYDRAFQSEIERIRGQGSKSTVYLTKVLERKGGSSILQNRLLAKPSSTPGSTTSDTGGPLAMADVVARIMKGSKETQVS